MQLAKILIIVCGLLALVYGLITARKVLAASAGTARMLRSPPPFRKAPAPT